MGEIGGVGEGKQEVVYVSDASDKADVSSDAPKQADPFDPREDKQQQSLMSKGDKQGSQTRTKQGDTAPAPGDAENPQGSPEDSQQDTFPDGSHQDGSPESSQQDAFPDGSHQNESQSEVHDTQGEYRDPFDPRNDHPHAQPDANVESSQQNDNKAQTQTESLQQNDSQSQDYSKQGEYGDPFDPRNDQPQAQPDANRESPQQNDSQAQVYTRQGEYGDPFDPRNDHPQEQSNANAYEANGERQTVQGEQARRDDPFHPLNDQPLQDGQDNTSQTSETIENAQSSSTDLKKAELGEQQIIKRDSITDETVRADRDKIFQERQYWIEERNRLEAQGQSPEALSNARYQVNEASRKLGEYGAEYYAKEIRGASEADKVYGSDISRSGDFDQVWKINENGQVKYLVIEAKGGYSGLGSRMVDGMRCQQGTSNYFDGIASNMSLKGETIGDDLFAARREGRVEYIKVQSGFAKSNGENVLGDIKIVPFKINQDH